MKETLEEFVGRQNAAFLSKQLGETTDRRRRRLLLTLLAEGVTKAKEAKAKYLA